MNNISKLEYCVLAFFYNILIDLGCCIETLLSSKKF